jgi:CrcB protein
LPQIVGQPDRRRTMLEKLVLIALAGAAGTLSRYWLSGVVYDVVGKNFPWGTAAVNILGSFLFGLVWELGEGRFLLRSEVRTVVLTGFMGAFTTFSTFVFESAGFLEDGRYLPCLANVTFQTVLGFAAMFGGLALGRLL